MDVASQRAPSGKQGCTAKNKVGNRVRYESFVYVFSEDTRSDSEGSGLPPQVHGTVTGGAVVMKNFATRGFLHSRTRLVITDHHATHMDDIMAKPVGESRKSYSDAHIASHTVQGSHQATPGPAEQ